MSVIVVDAAFKAKLLAAGDGVSEMRDEAGNFVAWYTPASGPAAGPSDRPPQPKPGGGGDPSSWE